MPNSADIELLKPGETILNGQYTIEKRLGSGGQGQVYLARHRIFDQVAIKRLHRCIADQPEGLARFERELRITNQLHGEHVIFIRNFDRDPARDEWFSVMEYANGGSLEDKLATEAPLPITEAIQLTITLCQALAHVHQFPYVHGDLKPSNVLFHATPNQELILKLSDFGSAFQPVQAGVVSLPSGLKAARTKLYVSPELLDASDPEDTEALKVDVDQRADIYAIGVILYEMLTGRPPFWEPSSESEDLLVHLEREHALLVRVKEQLPPEPKGKRREILPILNDLVMKALSKDPADRFASVNEIQASLKTILQEEEARLAELSRLHPLADQAFKAEQWGQASDLLYRILDLAPDDPGALQKLKIAQDQQQLMNLRHQVPRKMNEGLWQEAKGLIEEALKIAPGDPTLATWRAKIDDQLTIIGILEQAKKAENEADWREVINFCLEALRRDPSHVEASSLLSRAQTRYRIATLRHEAQVLCKAGNKRGGLEKLKEIQKLVPTDEGLSARIESLQKMVELETYYAQGKRAYDEGRWEEAIDALEKVLAIEPFYREDEYFAATLKADAQKKLGQEKVAVPGTSPKDTIPQQSERYLLYRPKRFFNSINIKVTLRRIGSLITHNKTLTIAAIIVAVLTIPAVWGWVSGWFVSPSVVGFKILIDGHQIEDSVTGEPINLAQSQLPTLAGGQSVKLKIVVVDENGITYTGNDLKCRWAVAPVKDESEDIKTEACEVRYTPSQSHSKQKVAVQVEGVEQQFKSVPLISMEFEITNK
jgi:serine/threonine protein kinase